MVSITQTYNRLTSNRLRVILQYLRGNLFQYGWLRALRDGRPIDANGQPLPWLTYPCIDFLRSLDLRDKSVFEWGCGHSTLFFAERAKRVVSIEAGREWFDYIKTKVSDNCGLILSTVDEDVETEAIEHFAGGFDVILIDNHGNFRPACCRVALDRLNPGGIIILDNSDQCLRSAEVLRSGDLIQVDFTGFAPGAGYAQTTSIFFSRDYSFRPLDGFQPHRSVAQPNAPWPNA